MKDHNGYEWINQPCRKDWNMACTTLLHNGHKRASFVEILTLNGYEVRREYTCLPCHMVVLVAAKKITGG